MCHVPEKNDLELKDVHFSYHSVTGLAKKSTAETEEKGQNTGTVKSLQSSVDTEVLHGVSMKIPEGSFVALVGPSGSGKSTIARLIAALKSTIARLIAALWDVTGGSISIGGRDIRDIPQEAYADKVAFVSQDNYLFNMTVRENIRLGRPSATDQEVEEAAKMSGCHDFILSLEKGYDTMVGSSGGHLSGGERQRISIARAMLKAAPVVILDEATAYTDPENEAVIQRSVSKLTEGKTLIVIASLPTGSARSWMQTGFMW